MTPQEQIDYVINKVKQYDMPYVEGETPISMAFIVDLIKKIEAHKAQPCEDAVKREAVLSTLDTMDKALDENRTVEAYKELLKECYQALPPVTPTAKESLVVEDCVRREDVLNALHTFGRPTKKFDYILAVQQDIKALPPVTPTRPKGKWIRRENWITFPSNLRWYCSNCGKYGEHYDEDGVIPFCKRCGADMREVKQDDNTRSS